MWKIVLTLANGLKHTLNDVRTGKPGWGECQPSGIEKIEFSFEGKNMDTGKKDSYDLVLSGMSEYNFFVEAMRSVSGRKTTIKGMWFLGKVPLTNKIVGFVLGDQIAQIQSNIGEEYNGLPTVGWKKGIVGGKVIHSVIRR
jgi:hypothetical protein